MSAENVIETDVLIIGGGLAGCFAAIKAREQGLEVILVDKGSVGTSGSSPFGANLIFVKPTSDFGECLQRFNMRSEYINNRDWTELLIRDSYARYQDLIRWGVEFLKGEDGQVYVWSHPALITEEVRWRRFYSMPVVRKQVRKTGVQILDRILITDLLTNHGRVVGAMGMALERGDIYLLRAKATVVCTGAASFRPSGWPVANLTADGEAMAYRAGAEIGNKEFVDTHEAEVEHPGLTAGMWQERATAPQNPDVLPPLPVRDSEPRYWNGLGEEIKPRMPGLAYTLDNIQEAAAGRAPVYRHSSRGRVAVSAGATAGMSNHACEGIWLISTEGAASLPGLFAAGDSGTANFMGAVYNASGSGLGGAAVSGARSGLGAANYARLNPRLEINRDEVAEHKKTLMAPQERKSGFSPRWVTRVLQSLMIPYYVLYIKKEDRLKAALTLVEYIRDDLLPKMVARDSHEVRLAFETRNMVYNAEAKIRASILRTESRGTHYREDYPWREDPDWLAWVTLSRDGNGRMTTQKRPVPPKWWPDLTRPAEERYPWDSPATRQKAALKPDKDEKR